ncbi:MAG: citrate/2-methylcitrate synthase, partial [Planctomycetota bacterium]
MPETATTPSTTAAPVATAPDSTENAALSLQSGTSADLPVIVGSQHEISVDITKLRGDAKVITLDPGYRNTGSCVSAITFINPEKGLLAYRGIPIEQLADQCSHLEASYLLIYGKQPTQAELDQFTGLINEHMHVDEGLYKSFEGFSKDASPMAMLSASLNCLCSYHPEVLETDHTKHFDDSAAKLLGKIVTLGAAIYRHRNGDAAGVKPDASLDYCSNFLSMMFGNVNPTVAKALDLIFLLHADHEQNCSASTCRMVGSSHASLFASVAAAVCALWGPLHGGANVEIMQQLESITSDPSLDAETFFAGVKEKKYRLFGFGHPVYKNYDPRARILKETAKEILVEMGSENDPLLKTAQQLEEMALADDYFVSRNLYPNVDFYSATTYHCIGLKLDLFTPMFALSRIGGWSGHVIEQLSD